MLPDIAARLKGGAARAGLVIPGPLADKLVTYYQLLAHWNDKINLTSLSDPDEAIDRLLLEPVAAAAHLPAGPPILMDLGSGGGSPALPLALALDATSLVMVESRQRKAAFLREAVRELRIDASVEIARFEELAGDPRFQSKMQVVSVRAVRVDAAAMDAIATLLEPMGTAALFRGPEGSDHLDPPSTRLRWIATYPLLNSPKRRLTCLVRT